jgi:hypothetical protein
MRSRLAGMVEPRRGHREHRVRPDEQVHHGPVVDVVPDADDDVLEEPLERGALLRSGDDDGLLLT